MYRQEMDIQGNSMEAPHVEQARSPLKPEEDMRVAKDYSYCPLPLYLNSPILPPPSPANPGLSHNSFFSRSPGSQVHYSEIRPHVPLTLLRNAVNLSEGNLRIIQYEEISQEV